MPEPWHSRWSGPAVRQHHRDERPSRQNRTHGGPGAHAILVLDGTGWHSSKTLAVPDNISLLPLPRYSPALNPPDGQWVGSIWQFLRANWLAISVFDDDRAIVDAGCLAWNRSANDPKTVTSITDRHWAQVKL